MSKYNFDEAESIYNKINLRNKGGTAMDGMFTEFYPKGQAVLIKKMLDAKFAADEEIASLLKISVGEIHKLAARISVNA